MIDRIKILISKVFLLLWYKINYKFSEYELRMKTLWLDAIIDIWANKWQSIDYFLNLLWKNIDIYSFEPLKQPFDILHKKYWSLNNVHTYNIWLWAKESEMYINVADNWDDSSSILEMNDLHKEIFPFTNKQHKELIKISTLDKIFENLNKQFEKQKILIKIDVQWYEIETLKWWKDMLSNVYIIIIETSYSSLYKDQPLFIDIVNFMQEAWFKYFGASNTYHVNKTYKPLQEDSIFINESMANE